MMKQKKLCRIEAVTVGEILTDLVECGGEARGVKRYEAFPGGAPFNAAVVMSRLGVRTAVVARCGDDAFGDALQKAAEENGVNAAYLRRDRRPTTLAAVSIGNAGERSFVFYRNGCADTALCREDLPTDLIRDADLLYCGSVALTTPSSAEAVRAAVALARDCGTAVAFDPNYRASLWPSEAEAIRAIRHIAVKSDILKLSEEELLLLTGTADPARGTAVLSVEGIPLILVTLGEQGAFWRAGSRCGYVAGFPCHAVDTNGAGDTFFGAFLSQIRGIGLNRLAAPEEARMTEALTYANRAASLAVSRRGTVTAFPTREEMENALGGKEADAVGTHSRSGSPHV